jgi:thiol-disulfide isomerase/thioredoxin
MKILSSILLSVFLLTTVACSQETNKTVFSEATNSVILIGHCNRDAFVMPEFQSWFDEGYESYLPDQKTIQELSAISKNNLNITIVMGTWCPDSRREVPRLYRIFDETGFPEDQIELISVNRAKLVPGEDISKFDAEKVPTIIVYKNNRETGRIIESPDKSLEEDLLQIMN